MEERSTTYDLWRRSSTPPYFVIEKYTTTVGKVGLDKNISGTTRKEKFLLTYVYLPMGIRHETIVIIDGRPMSWRAVKLQVDEGTPLGKKALKKLVKMDLLK